MCRGAAWERMWLVGGGGILRCVYMTSLLVCSRTLYLVLSCDCAGIWYLTKMGICGSKRPDDFSAVAEEGGGGDSPQAELSVAPKLGEDGVSTRHAM